MKKQYHKYKIIIRLNPEDGYYGLIYHPNKEFLTSTLYRNDEESALAQAKEIIDEIIFDEIIFQKKKLKKG